MHIHRWPTRDGYISFNGMGEYVEICACGKARVTVSVIFGFTSATSGAKLLLIMAIR